jgi:hypothetical protein
VKKSKWYSPKAPDVIMADSIFFSLELYAGHKKLKYTKEHQNKL